MKLVYGAAQPLAMSMSSLATSATWVSGRLSAAVDFSTSRYLDAIISGYVKLGTSPTAGYVTVWVYAQSKDTPLLYPTYDTANNRLPGTDVTITFSNVELRNGGLIAAASVLTTTTTGQVVTIPPFSLSALFRGVGIPKRWGVFVSHSTVVALDATNSNHYLEYLPMETQ